MRRLGFSVLVSGTLSALLALGCGAKQDTSDENGEAAAIGSAIELESGGLTMDDEAPTFDQNDAFQAAGVPEPETAITDALESSEPVATMSAQPDAAKYEVMLLWGHIPGERDLTPKNWSGTIRTNRGALLVRRLIRFDDTTDQLLPRQDPQVVAFTSVTGPHNDGLRLTVIDPTPGASEPLTISYDTPNGPMHTAPMNALVGGPESVVVDEEGNRFVAAALATPVDVCQFGMLGGRWHRVVEGRGRLLGGVVDARGDVIGHVKGLYGTRKNGDHVFFGKYINREGQFRGLFVGRYGEGMYEGKWLTRAGEAGKLGGHYWENIPGPETGGNFIGRWAETTCNLEVGPGAPVP